jgi:peptidylprolyl isomerase
MKRAILTTFAILTLAACSKKDENATTDTTAMSQSTTTTTTQTTPPPMDTTAQQPAATQPATAQPQAAPLPAPEAKPTTIIKHKDTTITPSGLKYIDKKVGKGASPKNAEQTVVVNYTGMLTNGKPFDSNVDPQFGHLQPFRTKLSQVVPGWTEGIATMKVGGKRRLIIPPDLGYGAQGMGDRIPPNSTLIFDVELLGLE